ncbi:MAG: redoxin domain-containing protein [Acidobacteriia bacterium]|nr:redoxin domain-containing protein [Terriglobia bacterium]
MKTKIFSTLSFALALSSTTLLLVLSLGLLGRAAYSKTEEQPIAVDMAAPELVGGPWLNTPGGKPIPISSRLGKVTVVEFWTFACINCRHNLPAYERLYKRFADREVTVIGIHTPETEIEHNPNNVSRRVKELGIEYPILLDQQATNWARWEQQYWPTIYLIDKRGRLRFRWEGELNYRNAGGEEKLARKIEELLQESN